MSETSAATDLTFAATYGPWAIVTGAAQGMGAAFAADLARRGVSVVMVDREGGLLTRQAHELEDAGGEVEQVVLDLAVAGSGRHLLDAVKGRDVGLLVANAAATYVGMFVDQPLQHAIRQLDVNCRATLEMVHGLLPQLIERGRGGLLLLSSLSAMRGTPVTAHYAATKAWNLILAESLHDELRDTGVTAMAVLPGTTRTPGWESQRPHDSVATAQLMEPADVARESLDALGTAPSFVPGQANRDSEAFMASLPRADALRLMGDVMRETFPPDR